MFSQNLTQYIIIRLHWNFEKNLWSGSVYIIKLFKKMWNGCVFKKIRNVVTSNFVQSLRLLRVKRLYFFSNFSRSKENTENLKSTHFLGNKGKTKLSEVYKCNII